MTAKNVTVYSTPTCPYCVRAKEYLTKRGVVYKDLNVAVNQEAAQEMVQKSGQMSVPVIVVDDKVVVGFDQRALEKLLS
ncbi:MAG: Uxx-star family glutaredoxin-like (seleno)protein [Dehalococcoidales bacterium]|nr:Uxx-star family glutaredoxin-like (seleno)protein [Dehalococcoidales bacterium]